MYNYRLVLFLITFSFSINLFAQDKFEKESRIKSKEVPSKAFYFIDSLKIKVKWYKEEGLNTKNFEAKFKHKKIKYSVEFDSLGNIEDVEIGLDWQKIKSDLRDSIQVQLQKDCSRHRISKVQRQFTGSEKDLFALLITGNNLDALTIKYEIIIRCKQQNKVNLFEYLFNDKGILISKSKIIFKNSSHLEY
jgi:hypothetical protein